MYRTPGRLVVYLTHEQPLSIIRHHKALDIIPQLGQPGMLKTIIIGGGLLPPYSVTVRMQPLRRIGCALTYGVACGTARFIFPKEIKCMDGSHMHILASESEPKRQTYGLSHLSRRLSSKRSGSSKPCGWVGVRSGQKAANPLN